MRVIYTHGLPDHTSLQVGQTIYTFWASDEVIANFDFGTKWNVYTRWVISLFAPIVRTDAKLYSESMEGFLNSRRGEMITTYYLQGRDLNVIKTQINALEKNPWDYDVLYRNCASTIANVVGDWYIPNQTLWNRHIGFWFLPVNYGIWLNLKSGLQQQTYTIPLQ